ncbi:MAG: filamentous hemagglutinin N-terminal domain-containing protein [Leptolyngbyaceae cyanobacterium SM2_5_2]|nr:filamentous hemagglutinin N-terminal domain-containing protein [Leptolyngbyaceae cyanobacterium SM2_5_2]
MLPSGPHRFCRFHRVIPIGWLLGFLPLAPTVAQIIPDTTLPGEVTTVVSDTVVRSQGADLINGGALRGSNLFHSFLEFNIAEGQRVYFANPAGVETILGRVTGPNGSNILGSLGVDGSASLFLLNPNGILFGPNAQLDISGSFLASTADSFTFADGSQFSATIPQAGELLSVNVPLGVQWGPGEAGPLTNNANLAVPRGQTLSLVGGDVTLRGSLEAPAGRVEVLGDTVSLLDAATIDVSDPTGGGTVLVGGDYQGQGTTPRAARTTLDPAVIIDADATTSGNGGTVIIWADDATQFYGTVSARGGSESGNGGFVEVSSPRTLVFDGQVNTTAPNGITGLLLIDPVNIRIVPDGTVVPDGEVTTNLNLSFDDPPAEAVIFASTINSATTNVSLQATNNISLNAPLILANPAIGVTLEALGNIEVNADIGTDRGNISLIGSNIALNGANIGFEAEGGRTPGNITLRAIGQRLEGEGNIQLNNFSVAANTDNPGNAPNVIVEANGNILLDSSRLTASNNSSGDGGRVIISNPEGLIRVGNASTISSSSGSSVGSGAQSGAIEINTNRLDVQSGGKIQTITFGIAPGGSINIDANEITVVGEISASTLDALASGGGGSIDLTANLLTVDGGFVGAQSNQNSPGDAGTVIVNVNQLAIRNSGRISTEAQGSGSAGNLAINALGEVDINTDGRLTVSSQSQRAGNLTIRADSATLNNGRIEARTNALDSESGNIDIHLSGTLLRLENGSQITAAAAEGSSGGNVTIKLPNGFLLVQPNSNSDILANANRGPGGNITVTAEAIFGIEERNPTTDFSDFNASSETDIQGEITLLTLGIDPSRGLAELPINVVDVSGLVATGCVGDNRAGVDEQGEFSMVGRGGITQGPTELVTPQAGVVNPATLDEDSLGEEPVRPSPAVDTSSVQRFQEAQGLARNSEGQVEIVAQSTTHSANSASTATLNCNAL